MKFELNGIITFSKDVLEETQTDIIEVLNDRSIFLKGVPEGKENEASKIVDYKFNGKELKLNMISGTYTRAHEGIVRLKKPIMEKVGRKHQIGIRDILIERYVITIPAGEEYIEALQSKNLKVPECEVEYDKNGVKIIFTDMGDSELKRNIIDRAIKFVRNDLEKLEKKDSQDLTFDVCKIAPCTIVSEYKTTRASVFEQEPTEIAEAKGWVRRFVGRGQWFYTAPMTKLFRAFESLIVEECIEKVGFDECLFPKLIPLDVMYKMRYLEGLPEGMYYVCPPKRDPEMFEEFVNEMMIKKEIPVETLKGLLRDPGYVLAPAQCEPFYSFFDHELVDVDKPFKFFDKSGWTYRWEGGGAKGLDRVNEFLRGECVWMGSPEFVEKTRDDSLLYAEKLAEKLDLEYWTEVGDDPFYLEGRKSEDRGIEFPDVPKYEMRLWMPHIKDERKGVAVTSANIHGTHFIEGFGIKDYKGRKVWTGCTGYGLTRWVMGFLSQYGLEFEDWPELIQKKIGKMPEAPSTATWPIKN
ncbi:serine--tRNA ligase [Methanococcus voltae]|uniref:Type-2 serine--tRNA ligase n=1 Tax=Methanococcus voltae (strain ATCC BAA-1334 / A3) TaxID=456320 RepID=D7DTG1_METV3|nr:serine--tRNA ligase [Methanococcus voltae]MCS3901273.1 seryl-tRNA synthetase [Methanococcus voltae]